MSKRDDQRIAALARKNQAASQRPKKDLSSQYDDTLKVNPTEEDPDTRQFFKEMKRREF
jgi:hypothetical protein